MKITQKLRTIVADFSNLENQYSNGTIEIPVEFTDSEFTDWDMFFSCQILNFESYNYIAKLVNNKIVLPLSVTYYAGVVTISIYGMKGDLVKTSNNIAFNIIESNPTADQVQPVSTDWATAVKDYVDAYTAERINKITPSINGLNFHWFIGQTDTGVIAKGDVCTIDPTSFHWLINGIDTGVVALGRTELNPATNALLGGIKVGNDLTIDSTGVLGISSDTVVNATLVDANWTGTKPYIYELEVNGVVESSNQFVKPSSTITEEQFDALSACKLVVSHQEINKIVFKALGDKPTVNIPIEVTLKGGK